MSKYDEQVKEIEECPECGLPGEMQPPPEEKGKKLIITFICPNGHTYQKIIDLK
ncbi:MAG: hypothetical protein AB7W47_03990 [Calditrichaceae bacterium]